jgi:chondroitin-sulfate-ABC endolyase/exolyase
MHKKILSSLLIALLSQHLFSAATFSIQEPDGKILGFERRVDFEAINSDDSTFVQSDTISMLGEHSLQWDWRRGSRLKLPLYNYCPKRAELSPFAQNQCLVIWVYNESPSEGHLIFSLGSVGEFPLTARFYLDYTGWRTAHIPLSQMEGPAPQMGDYVAYEWLSILVPEDYPQDQGRFFIDDVYTSMIDARYPSADYQAPYVHGFFSGEAYATQWLNQKKLPTRQDLKISQIPIYDREVNFVEQMITAEYEEMTGAFAGKGLSGKEYTAVLREFEKHGIRELTVEGKTYLQSPYISLAGEGLPQNLVEQGLEEGRMLPIIEFEQLLYNLARAFVSSSDWSQKEKLRHNFILATHAYLQSGWAAGSHMGALHHLGYNNRKIAPAFFMMKHQLSEAGLLQRVSDSLNWFVVAHVVNDATHTDPDLDLFNTVLYAHYLATMMHTDLNDCARHAKLLSQWLSRTYADDGDKGGFRHDGTAWHHWGHYPAYLNGAIDNAVKVANKLTLAGFPLDPAGHVALQNAIKTIMLYQQGDRYPRSLSGRHPLNGSHRSFIHSDYMQVFADLDPVDRDLQELHQYHTSGGVFDGNWTLPYSAMILHRRGDALAAVRGFSIYTWGSEIYNFNRFGRYQSYGTLDILYRDEGALAYEGYDWNLNPGTTITYLPLEELESPIPIWMVSASTRFANGVHDADNRNGAYGFELNDSMLINIDPGYEEIFTREKLTARKSTFFMDDFILCLGSGISGQHPTAPVYTVVTQHSIDAPADAVRVNGEPTSFPYKETIKGTQTLFDGEKTGYLVLGESVEVVVSKREQISRGDESTFDDARRVQPDMKNGKPDRRRELENRGDFLSAYIDHGVTPKDGRYSYIVFPSVDSETFQKKAEHVYEQRELFYRIISRKNTLHAVRDVRLGTDNYICYAAQDMIPHAALHSVSEPSLLIFKEESDGYAVSAALPDLHQTAYSREHSHKRFVSRPQILNLVFDGLWVLDASAPEVVSAEFVEGQTIISIRAQHGISNHFRISSLVE